MVGRVGSERALGGVCVCIYIYIRDVKRGMTEQQAMATTPPPPSSASSAASNATKSSYSAAAAAAASAFLFEATPQVAPAPIDPEGDNGRDLAPMPAKKGKVRNLLSYVGPGFLVCIGYIDPGNFEIDLQAGADYKYQILWALLLATCAALFIQSLASNLGVVTGQHLAEHCKAEYPGKLNIFLWLAAEVAIVAGDVPEVLGTALALNMLLKIPVWIGVLLTGIISLAFLGLQRWGARKLELIIASLVFAMAICFFVELGYAKPDPHEVLEGIFKPRIAGPGATELALSFVGSTVMPHNLYLHSALVLSRKTSRNIPGIKEARLFFLLESGLALFMSFMINMAVVSISGAVCSNPYLPPNDQSKCHELDLNQASFLLRNVLGNWSSILFGITIIASGQSSTITGTYAGQYVMQGFINIRLTPWARNLFTRSVAIVPSLIVALIGGARAAGSLIIIASMVLSFELPFAFIPLLKFTSNKAKMGVHKNHIAVTICAWVLGFAICGVNVYYLGSALYDWLVSNNGLSRGLVIFIGIVGFGAMLLYLVVILYLLLRRVGKFKDVIPSIPLENLYVEPTNLSSIGSNQQDNPAVLPSLVANC